MSLNVQSKLMVQKGRQIKKTKAVHSGGRVGAVGTQNRDIKLRGGGGRETAGVSSWRR